MKFPRGTPAHVKCYLYHAGTSANSGSNSNSVNNVKFPRGTPAHVKCYLYHAGTSANSGSNSNSVNRDNSGLCLTVFAYNRDTACLQKEMATYRH